MKPSNANRQYIALTVAGVVIEPSPTDSDANITGQSHTGMNTPSPICKSVRCVLCKLLSADMTTCIL